MNRRLLLLLIGIAVVAALVITAVLWHPWNPRELPVVVRTS